MSKKISELTETTAPASTALFAVVDGGATKKLSLANLATSVVQFQITVAPPTGDAAADTAAINAALAAAKSAGDQTVVLRSGTCLINAKIVIPTDWQGELRGAGSDATTLKMEDGAELEAVIESANFSTWTGTDSMPNPSAGGAVWGFTIRDLRIDGNRSNNFSGVVTDAADGRGINLYARRYWIKNVVIEECAGIGFYSELDRPASANVGAGDENAGGIDGLFVHRCSFEGVVWRGPSDVKLERLDVGKCHDPSNGGTSEALGSSLLFAGESIDGVVIYAVGSGGANGSCEIGQLHTWGCPEGYCMRITGDSGLRVNADNLTCEGGQGMLLIEGSVSGLIQSLSVRNSLYGSTPREQVRITAGSGLHVGEMEDVRNSSHNGANTLEIAGNYVTVGVVRVLGNSKAGHAVVLESGAELQVGQIHATFCQGDNADSDGESRALWTASGLERAQIGLLSSRECDRGWYNESTGRIQIGTIVARTNAALTPTQTAIELSSTPELTSLRAAQIVTNDTTAGNKYNSYVGTDTIDDTSTTEQTFAFTHNMWRTPGTGEVQLTRHKSSGTAPTVDYMHVTSITSTQVNVAVKNSVAGTGSSTLAIRVN